MVRDIRSMSRGLLAPLTQAALAALRSLAEGSSTPLSQEHRARLLDLGLIEATPTGDAVTALGRERLVSDR